MRKSIAVSGVLTLVAGLLATVATTAPAGASPATSQDQALAAATAALTAHRAEIAGSAGDGYVVARTSVDPDGASHVRYNRTYRGLPVIGGDFVVHNAPGGAFAGASSGLAAPISANTTPGVQSGQAAARARQEFTGQVSGVSAPRLVIDATSGTGRLAWETVVSGVAAQTPSRLHVLTDAQTGAVLGKADAIKTLGSRTASTGTGDSASGGALVAGTGNSIYAGSVTIDTTLSGSTYTMIDPSHGNGNTCDMNQGTSTCTNFTDPDNTWGNGTQSNRQSAGVDAHYGAALTFDYFKNVHGRNGIFGNGQGVPSRVHYGNAYINAFWDGSRMTYGDGASNQRPLVSIDVAGHEMAHGVTEALSGLVYSGESGGLNEATSDIFGNMVEFYGGNASDPGDYQVGEKININGNGTPLRYMYNPGLDGSSHTCWSTSTQNVDVHYSSGVGNHFYFNLAEGTGATPYGTSPLCGSNPGTVGIGRAKAEKIWYRALDLYFTTTTRYVLTSNPANTSRAYTLTAAKDLYGLCSTEYKAVQSSWTSVNVAGNDAPCTSSQDFSIAVSPGSGNTNPGGTLTATVTTTTTVGAPQAVTLSSAGAPSGVTVGFNPVSGNSGFTSTMTISTTAGAAPGTYTITITGTGTAVTRSTSYALTINGTGGCGSPGQKLGNPGFEVGSAPWTATAGVIGAWGGTGAPRTGTRSAWLDGYGTTHTDTLSQTVSIPQGCANYTLSFYLKITTSETTTSIQYDRLTVQLGATTLATYSNLNANNAYALRSFNVSGFAGQTVTLKFTGTEDVTLQTSFVIDDTALNVS
ncbi:M4 family metallopeptidase [Longispora albida]|uniref:M4 family metallopeptidase n=1 Tax=Longispora albida TaxID=203523 RepID=UPI0003798300|nr:M4 family metallopeptidase [Longispora albida]